MNRLSRIRDIQQAANRFEADFERRYGINLNEAIMLHSLEERGRLSSGELGALLRLSPSNMSKVIASAERKRLAKRIIGKSDKRRMYFSITPEGRKLTDEIAGGTVQPPDILGDILGGAPHR